ncbi:MAG: ABC transporter permease [Dehalococcoidia bacterium]|nr:ABC transporter permease [Dehalococcoidia bacterium]MCA9845898.1 ABC transporter permease [Dehalococcoidia bacterium]
MPRYVVERLAQAVVTIWIVTVVVFVLARLSGDPINLLVSPEATQAELEIVRRDYGLDKSWMEQYVLFTKGILRGEFGDSLRFKEPALPLVLERLPATLRLAFAGMSITLVLGLSIGTLSGLRESGVADRVGKFTAMVGQSVPAFWLGIMLILVFGVELGWLPTSGYGGLKHMILPAITLAHFSTAALIRLTRSAVLDVASSDYVRLARLKGLAPIRVVTHHILRNAAIPIVTMASIQFVGMLTGAIVTETIFAWPGMGRLMIDSVSARDFPVVQAGVVLIAVVFVLSNLFVDLLYGVLDPRISY